MGVDAIVGVTIGAALSALSFVTTGGVDLGPNTWAEIVLILIGVAIGVAAVLRAAPGRRWGAVTVGLFGVLTVLTIASISWSVQPSDSWIEANRTLSYLAAFGGAAALARLMPERWVAIVGSIAMFATIISGYALLAKVFPGSLDRSDPFGRVNLPFDYWNAVGLVAAMGIPAWLWLGSRADDARASRALAVPAIALLLTTVVLTYSRSAVIAAIVGVAFWFVAVPLRLRGALVLALGAAGAAACVVWALATHALIDNNVALAARTIAGHAFGLVLLLTLALTTVAGFTAAFAVDRYSLSASLRRRVATALLVLVAAMPAVGVAALAASSRGLTGEISHVVHEFTSANSGGSADQAGRLLTVDNSRGTYWNQAVHVAEHALFKGVGAGGFATVRGAYSVYFRADRHAHSFVMQTFADFGLLGLLTSIGLSVAWVTAAVRTVRSRRRTAGSPPPTAGATSERAGLLSLVAVVVTFGVQSAVDWTWFIPGASVPALICAGWIAGRGPVNQHIGRLSKPRFSLRTPAGGAATAMLAAIVVLTGWAMLGPLRSQNADAAAITALTHRQTAAAMADARTAVNANPLSVDPLRTLSALYEDLRQYGQAHAELVKATQLQPRNALPWLWLGQYDLRRRQFGSAIAALNVSISLDLGLAAPRQVAAQALTEEYSSSVSRQPSTTR
jgi:hypothetical protein